MNIEILKEFRAFEIKISEFDWRKHAWNYELGRCTYDTPEYINKVPNHFPTGKVALIDTRVIFIKDEVGKDVSAKVLGYELENRVKGSHDTIRNFLFNSFNKNPEGEAKIIIKDLLELFNSLDANGNTTMMLDDACDILERAKLFIAKP